MDKEQIYKDIEESAEVVKYALGVARGIANQQFGHTGDGMVVCKVAQLILDNTPFAHLADEVDITVTQEPEETKETGAEGGDTGNTGGTATTEETKETASEKEGDTESGDGTGDTTESKESTGEAAPTTAAKKGKSA